MDNNENKICNGYESNYLFLNDADFKKHLEECEMCAKEHEKMQKVSQLIQEAKPYIKTQKKNRILKTACALFLFVFASLSLPLYTVTNDIIAMNSPTIEEMGLPVDEYGLLLIE